jgi:hypothetical protein
MVHQPWVNRNKDKFCICPVQTVKELLPGISFVPAEETAGCDHYSFLRAGNSKVSGRIPRPIYTYGKIQAQMSRIYRHQHSPCRLKEEIY